MSQIRKREELIFAMQLKVKNLIRAGLLLAIAAPWQAFANPVTVTRPFLQLNHFGVNSLGFNGGNAGDFIRFGADSVTPNGSNGTTGLASTCNTVLSPLNNCTNTINGLVTRTINFNPSPLNPNFFVRDITYNSQLLGPWTIAFTNNVTTPNTTANTLSLPAGAQFGT